MRATEFLQPHPALERRGWLEVEVQQEELREEEKVPGFGWQVLVQLHWVRDWERSGLGGATESGEGVTSTADG
ncbi:MAG: hypothetical protein HC866_19525 [Leptolyngbyaceae cyanobacterium RU_5_1]|nr:hypothetical protein [Leptolyngbyaceae cyanobacterium RU_5_1]